MLRSGAHWHSTGKTLKMRADTSYWRPRLPANQLTFAVVGQRMFKRTNICQPLGLVKEDYRTAYFSCQRSLAEYASTARAPWTSTSNFNSEGDQKSSFGISSGCGIRGSRLRGNVVQTGSQTSRRTHAAGLVPTRTCLGLRAAPQKWMHPPPPWTCSREHNSTKHTWPKLVTSRSSW